MKRAAIVAVGSELLRGDGLDTNSRWLSRRLERLGYATRLHVSCLDDVEDIVAALTWVAARADVVICTGGLGPTGDDLTAEAVARFLEVPLELHQESLDHIAALFARFGRSMAPSNEKQAHLPAGARVLTNKVGTAPAFSAEREGTTFYSLPGVPREVYWLWDHYLHPELARGSEVASRAERTFRTVGIAESTLGERLGVLEQEPDLEVRYAVENSHGTIRVTILTTAGEDRAQDAWLQARELLGHRVVAQGNDMLPESVVSWLRAKRLSLATAESCTGGRVAAALVSVPGVSAVYQRGFVTYSNEAKHELLGVPQDVLAAHGAVSEQVALAMARGVRERAGADLGLGVTGVAGPGGGSDEKPVGLVHLAVAGPGQDASLHLRRIYPGDRGLIQVRAMAGALGLIRRACAEA